MKKSKITNEERIQILSELADERLRADHEAAIQIDQTDRHENKKYSPEAQELFNDYYDKFEDILLRIIDVKE